MPPSRKTQKAFEHSLRGPPPNPSQKSSNPDFWGLKPPKKIPPKDLPVASPSASILLVSPTNQILLLHRVTTSTSFASAHVFPGGHLSPQDGPLPAAPSPARHEDSKAYRMAAIRECFEESGILLARRADSQAELLALSEAERDEGRKAVHAEEVHFDEWLGERGAVADLGGLVPFTRWLTPAGNPKRFSTQMYLYFLPLEVEGAAGGSEMHIPTPDGGLEHTAAMFLWAQQWVDEALNGEVVLFPPQFFLLSLIARFLEWQRGGERLSAEILKGQRRRLLEFVEEDGDPPWGEKCISPNPIKKTGSNLIMGLAEVGPELESTGRRGDAERVIRVELDKEVERGRQRPRPKEVLWRKDVLGEESGRRRGRGRL